ncbi:unnamed protein product [Fraxinus pennsylvanica]|uniref:MATH domain-containing protein n=1 Tax=Fraxinus pennsylvanica TaxID=56036 RepID=A0AAD1ZJF1_9LAMI|nr:unnamed protein product [Fraxinus pennsylvanica]
MAPRPSAGVDNEVTVGTRDFSPAHFLFKIESFSLLSKNGIDKYESSEFESGDYKWKLIIYPNGRNTEDGGNHVSAYLVVADINSLPNGWEFNAFFSIFLFNHEFDNFMFMKGQQRFHLINPEWGFSNFVAKEDLMDPTNGFIVDDKCVFGAEVFVIKSKGIGECLSLFKVTDSYTREFKISNYSVMENQWFSEEFITDSLENMNGSFVWIRKDMVNKRALCFDILGCDINGWFSPSWPSLGWSNFISITDINDPKKGFVVGDSCVIEVEISIKAVVRSLPLASLYSMDFTSHREIGCKWYFLPTATLGKISTLKLLLFG